MDDLISVLKSNNLKFICNYLSTITASEYNINEDVIFNFYQNTSFNNQIALFQYIGKYPTVIDINKFETELIKKYVSTADPQTDYIILLINNKQLIYDNLFISFLQSTGERNYLLLEKIIFLFIEYGDIIKTDSEKIIQLTRNMHNKLSFVLAAFISRKSEILKESGVELTYLPRLEVFIKKYSTIKVKDNEMDFYNDLEIIDLPHTIQECIIMINAEKLQPEHLIFYIFTAPIDILEYHRDELLPLFFKTECPFLTVIFCQRTNNHKFLIDHFCSNCENADRIRLLHSFRVLKEIEWESYDELKKELLNEIKNIDLNDTIKKKIHSIL